MAGMPDWFAKTREMAAMDMFFSVAGAKSKAALTRRYTEVLIRLAKDPTKYGTASKAMRGTLSARQTQLSLSNHFAPDWVHPLYFANPANHGHLGGLYWPTIPSSTVIDEIREGVEIAVQKALGDAELAKLGYAADYRDALWEQERANGIPIDGVLPLATSWNCVAPTGSDFFDVAALRGPSIVELAIATPQPYGISMTRRLRSRVQNQQLVPLVPGRSLVPPAPKRSATPAAAKSAPAKKAPAKKTSRA